MDRLFKPDVVMREDLRHDETILHVAYRHKILLFLRILWPAIICAGSLYLLWHYLDQTVVLSPLDAVLLTLAGVVLLTLLLIVYMYYDWRRDQIVLTDQRVIYNVEKPLIRRIQEQLPINDIHQVEIVTSSYLEHWMNLGSIKIQSAAFTRSMIFRGVSHPQDLQNRIMRLVDSLKQDGGDTKKFQDMINRRIYHDQPPEPGQSPQVQHTYTPHVLSWLFAENPHYDDENHSYIWHPHWFFLLKELIKPTLLLLLALVLVIGGAYAGILNIAWILGLLGVTAIIVAGWLVWEVSDHRNDRYILTPSQVIDIEKLPLGPENQSSAGLDSIQNVTYTTTLFSRIIGYGDVWMELAGSGDRLTFYNVPLPRDVVSVIDSYQGQFNKSQKERNLEDTLKLLHSYHELQQEDDAEEAASHQEFLHGNNGRERHPEQEQPSGRYDPDDKLLQYLLRNQI
jgi:uncharacterized membrane protein YdbT with pleckstrin-like domain